MRWPLSILLFCAVASGQSVPEGLLPSVEAPVASALPAPPSGRSTVMGGEIQKVDPVRDQLALKIAGGHDVKILFDERTQVFQDGKKISVLDLKPEDHASIETRLDGTSIFAMRIHVLSTLPDGQLHGQVLSYNRQTNELKLQVANSKNTMTILAPEGTPVERVGQGAFAQQKGAGLADLVHGTLVDVTFKAGKTGPGAATRIDVFAVPGAEFVVRGNLSALDLKAGRMSITNEENERPVDIAFEPARFPVSHDLHQGGQVQVTARFDGTHYIASDIVKQ